MESAAQDIHENMRSVVDYQTHHRLREAQVGPKLLLYLQPELKNCKSKFIAPTAYGVYSILYAAGGLRQTLGSGVRPRPTPL